MLLKGRVVVMGTSMPSREGFLGDHELGSRKEIGVHLGDHLLGVKNHSLLTRPAGLLLPLTTLPSAPQNIKTDSLPLCRGDLAEKLLLVGGGGC